MVTTSPISHPEPFRSHITNLYGQEGEDWLAALPALRQSLRARWNLHNIQPLSQLSYNYLEFALSPTWGPVVLKIGYPNPELASEIQALSLYQGAEEAVQLLDQDPELGALLLERIHPGQNLTAIPDDEKAARIAASSMLKLRQPVPEQNLFPTLEDWCQAFSRYHKNFEVKSGPIPAELFHRAADLKDELLASSQDQYLLHGDLHHGNLLNRGDGSWIVIDPKGVAGNFAAEIGPFLFNPIPALMRQNNPGKIIKRRLRIFEEMTGLEGDYLAAWSFVRTLLAAIWTVEEGSGDLDHFLIAAEYMANLLE